MCLYHASIDGQVIYSKALEALDITLRAPELAFKLKGSYPTADQIQANVGVRVILMDKIPWAGSHTVYPQQRE